jgi:hypothetical protein
MTVSTDANSLTADDLAGILAENWVRLVIHPEAVSRYLM